jgi:hypothetical protein
MPTKVTLSRGASGYTHVVADEATLNVNDSGGFVGVKNMTIYQSSPWIHQMRVVRTVALMAH